MLSLLALSFAVLILGLVALPVLFAIGLVFLVLKLVLFLVFLPIQVVFWGIGGAFHVAGFLVKVVLGVLLFGLIGMILLGLIFLPLIPILLLFGLGWLIHRFFRRPKPAPAV